MLLFLTLPLFSLAWEDSSCPYNADGFISAVKEHCSVLQNMDYCVDLAQSCKAVSKKGVSASLFFMGKINPKILDAMFEAGLRTPFENRYFAKDEKSVFLCDMVIDNAKGNLPAENFKVIWRRGNFTPEDLSDSFCYVNKLKYNFRPHELAALLDLRQLTAFFTSLRAPMVNDSFFNIPLDIWAAAYYRTDRAEDFFAIAKNPANIIYIDEDTDFSLFMPKGTQVMLLGEAHHARYYKTAQKIIKSLKCSPGLTHFASEFLLEMQEDDIAEFRRTGNSCKIKLPTTTRASSKEALKAFKGMNDTNMACLTAAGCDTEFIPLERTSRILGYDEEDNKKAKREYLRMLSRPPASKKEKEARLLQIISFLERNSSVSGVGARNYEWADLISDVLEKDSYAKIFAYMGKAHSIGTTQMIEEQVPALADILRRNGFKVKTVSLSGGSYDLLADSFVFRSLGLHNKHFIFKVPQELKGYFNVDFIVHIPSSGSQEKALKSWVSSHKTKYYAR